MASSPGHPRPSSSTSPSLGRLNPAFVTSTYDVSAGARIPATTNANASTFELHRAPPHRPHPISTSTRANAVTAAHKFTTESRPTTPRDIYELFPPHSPHSSDPSSSDAIRPLWKRSIYLLLEQPTSSPSAFTVHVLSTGLIVLSALITVLETVPAFHYISGRTWFGMESALVALFTVEYIARCIAWSYSWGALFRWVVSFFGIIDLLSVLPYYIELMLHQDTSVLFRFSILRMFRLLRVFRPFRYNHTILLTIEVMYLSVRRSQHALLAIGFFVVMILTVFSTLLYFAERGTWDEVLDTFVNSDGDPTQFTSIPAAAWFVIVTITTVGYGEITPRSFLGRLVTLPILVFGLLLITLPSFVLGREFSLVWGALVEGQAERERGGGEGDGEGEGGRSRGDRERDGNDLEDEMELLEGGGPSAGSNAYYPPRSARASASATLAHTRAHAGSYDPFTPQPPQTAGAARDLSNLKLAQNQTELSRQIEELRAVVEGQGRLVGRLVGLLEGMEAGGEGVRRRRSGDGEES